MLLSLELYRQGTHRTRLEVCSCYRYNLCICISLHKRPLSPLFYLQVLQSSQVIFPLCSLLSVVSQHQRDWSPQIRLDFSESSLVSTGEWYLCLGTRPVTTGCDQSLQQFELMHWHTSWESLMLAICLWFLNPGPFLPLQVDPSNSLSPQQVHGYLWVASLTCTSWWEPKHSQGSLLLSNDTSKSLIQYYDESSYM